ncbi:MFS transporter [Fodinicola acaciae]|uniref:MFS transporter n=1 Tax=Fodinicola acaciae TaxID=2681555 RepID=UPI0013D81474|nr:MFS transporter [Fodinicola acaciae]
MTVTADLRPLRIPAFRRLWLASAVSAIGGSFSALAIPAQLFASTRSSATVGIAAGVSFSVLAVAALWGGALADRFDRRHVLLVAQAGLAATYALLWVTANLGSVHLLYVLVAAQGACLGAVLAASGATVPRVVPADLLPAANSLSSLVRYTGSIVGPLLAGVLIPVVGLTTLYLFDALALLAVSWAVFRLPALPPAAVGSARLMDGFRYLCGQKVLVAVMLVDLAAMVFGMPVALFPELATRAYGGAPGGGFQLGLLYAAYPAGVFVVGLLSGTFTRAKRHGALMASAAIAWGFAVVLLGLAPWLWLAVVALFLGGAVNFVLSTFRNAITQAATDDALRGRIQGALTVVLFGGPQIANLLHGLAGAAVGARLAISVGGLLTVAAVAVVVRAAPQLWRYRG